MFSRSIIDTKMKETSYKPCLFWSQDFRDFVMDQEKLVDFVI